MASSSLCPFLVSLALPIASLVACGGGDEGFAPPSGPHHGYVVDNVSVPDDKIFDLDGDRELATGRGEEDL